MTTALAEVDLIAEALTDFYGPRCPDFEPGCHCCEAWARYDALRVRPTATTEITPAMKEAGAAVLRAAGYPDGAYDIAHEVLTQALAVAPAATLLKGPLAEAISSSVTDLFSTISAGEEEVARLTARAEAAEARAAAAEADVAAHVRGTTDGPETYPAPPHGWTCFHCGETFMTAAGAARHFGTSPAGQAACRAAEAENARLTEMNEVQALLAFEGGPLAKEGKP